MKYILLIFLIFITPEGHKKEPHTGNRFVIENHVDTSYQYAISIIKKWETMRLKKYSLFGDNYIGYGHLLSVKDTIILISELQADSILKSDFGAAIKQVNSLGLKLPKNKRTVFAMFVFNCGIGTLKRSGLLKIRNDIDLEKEYIKYQYAGKRHIPKLEIRRMDEFKLWNKNSNLVIYQ